MAEPFLERAAVVQDERLETDAAADRLAQPGDLAEAERAREDDAADAQVLVETDRR